MKLREKITLRDSQRIAELYNNGLDNNLDVIIQIIATNDDGTEIEDVLDMTEDELLDVFAEYIRKKNKLMKRFTEKISE